MHCNAFWSKKCSEVLKIDCVILQLVSLKKSATDPVQLMVHFGARKINFALGKWKEDEKSQNCSGSVTLFPTISFLRFF